jgi:hypothetical protein
VTRVGSRMSFKAMDARLSSETDSMANIKGEAKEITVHERTGWTTRLGLMATRLMYLL